MVAVFADAEQVEHARRRNSRGFRSPPTTAATRCCRVRARIWNRSSPACSDDGIRCTWLETSHAFHSELLEPVLAEFESYAAQLQFAVPTRPLVCNRTGAVLTAETPLDARYWRRHSRQPVQFTESVQHRGGAGLLGGDGDRSATGSDRSRDCRSGRNPRPHRVRSFRCARASMRKRQIAEALAATYVAGHRPEFAALHRRPARRLELPTYPFQRRRFWPKTSGITGIDAGSGRYPESWVVQRISRPATPFTPAGCRSNRSRGSRITSSTAPLSFRARHTRRWPWPRLGRRRGCKRSSSTSRSS